MLREHNQNKCVATSLEIFSYEQQFTEYLLKKSFGYKVQLADFRVILEKKK